MAETDWEQRYQTGDMPWEKGEASPGLVDFVAAYQGPKGQSVLVPGCGTGHDVRVFAGAGFQAVGLDLAPSAVSLAHERTQAAGLSAGFHRSDFLSDPPLRPFDWVFEHTLFCAIQPERRDDYVQAVHRWLKPGGDYLAVYYLIDDTEGPPFGSTREEIARRFESRFEMKKQWVPRSYPNRTGLEWMVWWRGKP
ncbi:MAG: methyltransferase domain-containing protein [Verrucomicrobiales bacterium]|nr:methyltransferase domain-containing protein [Verrucomicrobiales bacterium]